MVQAVAGGTISGNDWSSWKRAKHPPRPFSSGQTERRDRRGVRRDAERRVVSHRWLQHGADASKTSIGFGSFILRSKYNMLAR